MKTDLKVALHSSSLLLFGVLWPKFWSDQNKLKRT